MTAWLKPDNDGSEAPTVAEAENFRQSAAEDGCCDNPNYRDQYEIGTVQCLSCDNIEATTFEAKENLVGWTEPIKDGDILKVNMTAGDDRVEIEQDQGRNADPTPIDLVDPDTIPDLPPSIQASGRHIDDGWPEPAEGGTLGGGESKPWPDFSVFKPIAVDGDWMASDWIPFALGALCSSIIWIIIIAAAKLLP